MKILVLNLPFPRKIIRRYSCSYYSNGFLYPPQELLRLATIIKQNNKGNTFFIDSIAEDRSINDIINFVKKNHIEVIFTLLSLDFIDTDLKIVNKIKQSTSVPIVSISYLASLFRNQFQQLDIVLDNFFEQKTYFALKNSSSLPDFINSLKETEGKTFDFNPNLIRQVDRSLINPKHYKELFCRGKTAFLYFGFGCPYKCNYCISSYDHKNYSMRKKEFIFEELEQLYKEGYKNVRVLDDNSTINKEFLKELDKFLKEKRISLNFYGLSRISLIDKEMAYLLKDIGFKRIYLGLETLNQKMQEYYEKNIDINLNILREKIKLLKSNKIETGLWMLFHPLKQTRNELYSSIKELSSLKADFVNLSILVPYPGTKLFDIEKENIHYSLNPFESEFKTNCNCDKIEKGFYFRYYLKPSNALRMMKFALKYPIKSISLFFSLFKRPINPRKDFI